MRFWNEILNTLETSANNITDNYVNKGDKGEILQSGAFFKNDTLTDLTSKLQAFQNDRNIQKTQDNVAAKEENDDEEDDGENLQLEKFSLEDVKTDVERDVKTHVERDVKTHVKRDVKTDLAIKLQALQRGRNA